MFAGPRALRGHGVRRRGGRPANARGAGRRGQCPLGPAGARGAAPRSDGAAPLATVRYEAAPGEQMQIDFGAKWADIAGEPACLRVVDRSRYASTPPLSTCPINSRKSTSSLNEISLSRRTTPPSFKRNAAKLRTTDPFLRGYFFAFDTKHDTSATNNLFSLTVPPRRRRTTISLPQKSNSSLPQSRKQTLINSLTQIAAIATASNRSATERPSRIPSNYLR